MIIQTVKWVGKTDGFLELIDQRKLPRKKTTLKCRDIKTVFNAIRTLSVRGAPAIGVAAAYGVVLGMQKITKKEKAKTAISTLKKSCKYLASSRPTAINLFWALERVKRSGERFISKNPDASAEELREVLLNEANAIYREDVEMCRRIGRTGEKFIKNGMGILTHCNAGALATAGQGTALSVLFEAHKKGKKFKVYVDETRPLLQGSRLTAWELKQAGIETILICDNMAGWLMKQGKINAVITGADRIAANGDVANKIGTYSLSVLAARHKIPFYVAAPSSTFDLNLAGGDVIPIEQRAQEEVTKIGKVRMAPEGVGVYNTAFDVTQAQDISAIITEKGVIERPNADKIIRNLKS
jgi:methylthioribose-1-phosphate isomerase